MERGESTESRRSRKGDHHHHSSHVRLDATVIPGPGSEERPSRRHHHTRSGSRGGGQSEHRKPRSHRKCAEDGEDGGGGPVKTGRHRSKGVDGGGEGGEQEGAGDGCERRPRRNRHGYQTDGEGKRMCQHRKKYVHYVVVDLCIMSPDVVLLSHVSLSIMSPFIVFHLLFPSQLSVFNPQLFLYM